MYKKRVQKKTSFHYSSLCAWPSLKPSYGCACSNFNLSVTPEVQYMWIKPGSKIRHTITLENKGTTPLVVTPSIHDFEADGASGAQYLKKQLRFPT
jgi:hypothetical protein